MIVLAKIVDFLNSIGIETSEGVVPDSSFLPGVRVVGGKLIYDPDSLVWPGDLLHEAGHVATVPSSLRPMLSDGIELPEHAAHATEAEATAWAFAAVHYLQLDPAVLFHPGGYHGASDQLISTFSLGVYPGAFGLAQSGMTRMAIEACSRDVSAYPEMSQWLRS